MALLGPITQYLLAYKVGDFLDDVINYVLDDFVWGEAEDLTIKNQAEQLWPLAYVMAAVSPEIYKKHIDAVIGEVSDVDSVFGVHRGTAHDIFEKLLTYFREHPTLVCHEQTPLQLIDAALKDIGVPVEAPQGQKKKEDIHPINEAKVAALREIRADLAAQERQAAHAPRSGTRHVRSQRANPRIAGREEESLTCDAVIDSFAPPR